MIQRPNLPPMLRPLPSRGVLFVPLYLAPHVSPGAILPYVLLFLRMEVASGGLQDSFSSDELALFSGYSLCFFTTHRFLPVPFPF